MKNRFKFSTAAWNYNNVRLTNQIFKLLPLLEEGKEWKPQRETILLELEGYNEMFSDSPSFMVLIAKLYALSDDQDRMIFRKLVFEAITELKSITIE